MKIAFHRNGERQFLRVGYIAANAASSLRLRMNGRTHTAAQAGQISYGVPMFSLYCFGVMPISFLKM